MKLILVTDDGEVLDWTFITREELVNISSVGALALIKGLQFGDAEGE